MSTPVIDMHVHYYTDRYLDAVERAATTDVYRRDDGRFVARWQGGVALTVPQPHPGVAQRIEMMDELGITTQVLSVPSPNAYFLPPAAGRDLADAVNEELAGIARERPARFRALGMVPLQDIDLALLSLEHALDQLEMQGVMLLTNVNGSYLDDPRFEPFWQAANDRSLLVYLHPTVPEPSLSLQPHALAIAVGFFADTNLALTRLAYSGVFERYPAIRWVVSHLGGTLPFMLPRLDNYWHQFPEARKRCPRRPSEYIRSLLFDTATTHEPAIRCALETYGSDRLVFGSDFPHVPGGTQPYLKALDAVGAVGEEYAALAGGRASELIRGNYV
ncbi:MAG TPA: amidohydrolase family protein [Jiangellales bacterium]|nr:amidohydrolase family protein [Jiangellales bacterium]